jgi:predicted ribosomally synthesized peptide with SipW-like signal peptide
MKKKLLLGITAATLALSLAIGGTLMLFTDTSDTATNVITFGDAEIELQEKNNNGEFKTITEKFTGNNFKNIVPGETLEKEPRVINTGNVPVYVKVTGELYAYANQAAKDAGTPRIDIEAWGAYKDNNAALEAFISSIVIDDHWAGVTTKLNEAGNAIVGTWYYIEGTQGATRSYALKALEAKNSGTYDETTSIFKEIKIPDTLTSAYEGAIIELKLTAHAVQSESNPYNSTSKGYDELDVAWTQPEFTPPTPVGP